MRQLQEYSVYYIMFFFSFHRDDLSKLEYLTMFIKESLRLYNPVPAVVRRAQNTIALPDGRVIPKGLK